MNNNDTLEHAEDTMPITDADVAIEFGGEDTETEVTETPETEVAETPETETPEVAAEPKKRGPKPIVEDPERMAAALQAIYAGAPREGAEMPSRFIEKKLAEIGMVDFVKVKKPGTMGAPRMVATLTPAALAFIGSPE